MILHNAFWLQFQKTAAATATANPNKRSNKEVLFVWELRYVHALIDRQESPPLSKVVCHYPCVYRHLIPLSALHSSFFNPSTATSKTHNHICNVHIFNVWLQAFKDVVIMTVQSLSTRNLMLLHHMVSTLQH